MSSTGESETHSEATKHDQEVEEDYFEETERPGAIKSEQQEDESLHKSDLYLRGILINDEKLYEALENFLLGDPVNQINEFNEQPVSHLKKGDEANAQGFKMEARVYYETAAKIAIYKLDKELAIRCLTLAEGVTENAEHSEFHKTILANMDEVMRISKKYYESVQPPIDSS